MLTFRDDRFESPKGWVAYDTSTRARNRYLLEDGLIWAETIYPLRNTPPEKVVAELRAKWDWWDRGRIAGYRRLPNGNTAQTLYPVWYYWVHVGLETFPDTTTPDLPGVRVPLLMSAHFDGVATNDAITDPSLPGGCLLRGRFHGVKSSVPLLPDIMVARAHLRAETGTLYPPLAFGTGFSGLERRLEGGKRPLPIWYNRVLPR